MNEPTHPSATRWWWWAGSVAAVTFTAFGVTQAAGVVTSTTSTDLERFDSAGLEALDLAVEHGDVAVTVTSGDTDDVVVRLRTRAGLRDVEHTGRRVGDRLVLSAECPAFSGPTCRADYDIEVPGRVAVHLTADDGDVEVHDVEGGVDADVDNGDITLVGSSGRTVISTDNGTLRARELGSTDVEARADNGDVRLDLAVTPRSVTATSDNGAVEVEVPSGDELYLVDATSENGDASTAVRTDPESDRKITARSGNGDVAVRYR